MNRDDSRSRDHRGVTWERRLAHSTRSYIGTAVARAVEDNITCFTKNGNMRSISKTQLVDNIVQAWDMISKDVIIKSFRICGQVKDVRPDEILCMKQGKPCEEGLGKLQELLAFPTHQVDLDRLEILPEGIVNEVVDLDYNEEMFEEENALGDL